MNSHQRHKKKVKDYFNLLNKLKNKNDEYYYSNGIFLTHHDLQEKDQDGNIREHWWIDLYFLSIILNKKFYNTSFTNLKMKFLDKIEEIAFDEKDEKFPYPDDYKSYITKEIPIEERKDNYKGKLYSLEFNDSLYNREDWNWYEERKKQLIREGNITVRESIKFDFEYKYGIGLHASINCKSIDEDAVMKFIKFFRDRHEKEYDGDKEYSFTSEEVGEV